MIKLSHEKCTGCRACDSVCPIGAISFQNDAEGFSYPEVSSEMCIKCGACDIACPVVEEHKSQLDTATSYILKNKDKSAQLNSASGGVFPALATAVLDKGGVVWGAQFDNNFNVVHSCVEQLDDLPRLCRSKYVQSNASEAYAKIQEQLNSGRTVLFSGTPCQCTALNKYLKIEYDKLYLIDIVCHGVPSPMVWHDFLSSLSEKRGQMVENISEIKFKYKNDRFYWLHPGFYVKWKNGNIYEDFSNKSWYENGYLGNLYVRPSCHNCNMKDLASLSDITIGDFWGCEIIYPEFYDRDGVSVAFIKTEKGNKLFNIAISCFDYITITIEDACKYNKRITTNTPTNIRREKFWRTYQKLRKTHNKYDKIDQLICKFTKVPLSKRYITYVKKAIKRILSRVYSR